MKFVGQVRSCGSKCGGAQVYDSASLMTSVSSVGCVAEAEVVIYVRRGSVTG